MRVGTVPIQVLFAPHRRDDPNQGINLLAASLLQARKRVDMALFVFSAQPLTDVLAQLQRQQVQRVSLFADPEVVGFYEAQGWELEPQGRRCAFWYAP